MKASYDGIDRRLTNMFPGRLDYIDNARMPASGYDNDPLIGIYHKRHVFRNIILGQSIRPLDLFGAAPVSFRMDSLYGTGQPVMRIEFHGLVVLDEFYACSCVGRL